MKDHELLDAVGGIDPKHVASAGKEKKRGRRWVYWAAAVLCVALVLSILIPALHKGKQEAGPISMQAETGTDVQKENESIGKDEHDPSSEKEVISGKTESAGQSKSEGQKPSPGAVTTYLRPRLISFSEAPVSVTPTVEPYTVAADLANVVNYEGLAKSEYPALSLSEEEIRLLEQNAFVVRGSSGLSEFHILYERNRYDYIPNFVTVDSLMHTYHLYFSLLLGRTEREFLAPALAQLGKDMLQISLTQYEALRGSEWEEAAARNAAYFAVGAKLQDDSVQIPSFVQEICERELSAVMQAGGIATCSLTDMFLDYSQFKPRGYYDGNEQLERYFRAMMWYGQLHFSQEDESLSRSALLMVLALSDGSLDAWEDIFTATSFFAGQSDDLGFFEYGPAIEAAYGALPDLVTLKTDADGFAQYLRLIAGLRSPEINSIPTWDEPEKELEIPKGFRFFGQRFCIDAKVFQNLVYRAVRENDAGEKRMLPDTLDVAAAMGSDAALSLLAEQGDTMFKGYSENMEAMRKEIHEKTEEFWSASLSSGWLYTLAPILEPKGEGYPSFMTNDDWTRKSLETFAGSYAELKHDTILYAKQVIAEMGGMPPLELDDRGYVEPEPLVYARFSQLAQQTADGLKALGMIRPGDTENLNRLTQLADSLQDISNKELRNELPTDAEFELIRTYGGVLEHFWAEAAYEQSDDGYIDTREFPASIVADIATDPNGSVLEVANAQPQVIFVIVPIEGELHLASGVVYDFYQFTQPLSDRMTDAQWRMIVGDWWSMDMTYEEVLAQRANKPDKPWWTESYRAYF